MTYCLHLLVPILTTLAASVVRNRARMAREFLRTAGNICFELFCQLNSHVSPFFFFKYSIQRVHTRMRCTE